MMCQCHKITLQRLRRGSTVRSHNHVAATRSALIHDSSIQNTFPTPRSSKPYPRKSNRYT